MFREDGLLSYDEAGGAYGMDWFEGAIARPGQVLKDLVRAVQPQLADKVRGAVKSVPSRTGAPSQPASNCRAASRWRAAFRRAPRCQGALPCAVVRTFCSMQLPRMLRKLRFASYCVQPSWSLLRAPPTAQDQGFTWIRNLATETPAVVGSEDCSAKSACSAQPATICPFVK